MIKGGPAVAAIIVATLVTAGCSQQVSGSARPVVADRGAWQRGYGYTDDRCGMLLDSSVQQIAGAQQLVRPYSGAVCQYVLSRRSTLVDLTYSWFESGSVDRERGVAQVNHAKISDIEVQGRPGFAAMREGAGNSCSATAATDPGIASWWAQIRGDASIDPCRLALDLLSRTLSSDM